MNSTESILTFLFSASAIIAALVYLGKKIIDKTLDIGVEKYKASLNKDLETHKSELLKKTEEFRANLQISSIEHQIRYSKLHEDRGQSIKTAYNLLIDLQEKLEYFTTMFQGPDWKTDQGREDSARESQQNFLKFFRTNRLYYPKATCEVIEEILKLSWDIIVDMSVAKVSATSSSTGPEVLASIREWREINRRVSSEIEIAQQKLQNEFKKLLGVE